MKKTQRGFSIFTQFKDLYGKEVRVQKSSLATKRAVWIFTEVETTCAGAHLSVAQAKRVIKALQMFVDGKE